MIFLNLKKVYSVHFNAVFLFCFVLSVVSIRNIAGNNLISVAKKVGDKIPEIMMKAKIFNKIKYI